MNKYDHNKIDKKWQGKWFADKTYKSDNKKGKKKYVLVELTYSSGDLHIGHWYSWTGPDVYARHQRMLGYNVLFPVGGFDSFGLPAENAAIKHDIHPQDWTKKNIDQMRKQFRTIGPSFDWDSEVITSDPLYYRWTQWLFQQLFKQGLAYRAKVTSNWCPKCKTVLANEHVEDGCCWRHTDTQVVQKKVDQWMLRITDYADRLIWPHKPESLPADQSQPEPFSNRTEKTNAKTRRVDWPKAMTQGQNNWIGKKQGIDIAYNIIGSKKTITCFTTTPVNWGATFVVVAPEYAKENLIDLIPKKNKKAINNYIRRSLSRSGDDRFVVADDKTGVDTGIFVTNHVTGERLSVWVSDFVLMDVGTGAVQGCPGHDIRDFEFATKYKIPIKRVVIGPDGDKSNITNASQVVESGQPGKMTNSDFLNGIPFKDAMQKTMDYFERRGWGKKTTTYHLRDWSVSRRRYWGAPIPMVYCKACAKKGDSWFDAKGPSLHVVRRDQSDWDHTGWWPVPDSDLPVELPYKVDYVPTGKAPLATDPKFVKVKCPHCGGDAERETETLDTYVDSAWYFFRYPDPKNSKEIFNKDIVDSWMPLDIYFGGPEHILGHTLYARFITKFLYDIGYVKFDEFAKVRRNHGVILGTDGYRMSKSRGNVVNPDAEVEKYGADAVRVYLCFMGPHDKGAPWNRQGIEGTYRFLQRVWRLFEMINDQPLKQSSISKSSNKKIDEKSLRVKMHQTIKKVTEDVEKYHYNTAISAIMEYTNALRAQFPISNYQLSNNSQSSNLNSQKTNHQSLITNHLKVLALLLAPFAPHMMEEIWHSKLKQKGSIHKAKWPKYDPKLIVTDTVIIPIQVNGKLRGQIEVETSIAKDKSKVLQLAKKDQKVSKHIGGKDIQNEVFVPGKLVNFVVN